MHACRAEEREKERRTGIGTRFKEWIDLLIGRILPHPRTNEIARALRVVVVAVADF